MEDVPAVLLLDDGELDSVCTLLDQSEIAYKRMCRSEIGDDVAPPMNLLIATPRHAQKVRLDSPVGALPGRPVRIVAVDEDSPSLRRMLRNMGFSILVRVPTHAEVWRALIQRALYQGDERRRETRLPVGAQIALTEQPPSSAGPGAMRESLLVDISNRGCHITSDQPFQTGARVRFSLPTAATDSVPLELAGEIVRTGPWAETETVQRFSAAVIFDADLSDYSRVVLARMINARISGPHSLAPEVSEELSLPSCDSPALPGLELDNETDPAIATRFEIRLAIAEQPIEDVSLDEKRKNRRADYQQRIEAETSNDRTIILIGRDLSAAGMRVERFSNFVIGAHLSLALYGLTESAPLHVDAEIIRDDGERGIALRFCNLPREAQSQLEKFITCLPAVESLEDGEAFGMGSVLTEVLPVEPEA